MKEKEDWTLNGAGLWVPPAKESGKIVPVEHAVTVRGFAPEKDGLKETSHEERN